MSRTFSWWGKPPTRIYNFINSLSKNAEVCVVGCSDGKFVLPFLRKGFTVTAIDMDETALFGGEKVVPLKRDRIVKRDYCSSPTKPVYEPLPTETVVTDGLLHRVQQEHLEEHFSYILTDYYRNPPKKQFDVVFTSCSLQYKSNRSIPVKELIATLQKSVKENGYLYMDYMMALEDTHQWKSEHFFRSHQLKTYFDLKDWEICYNKEMKVPIFEAAHIDRPEDHFHRFGYILARKKRVSQIL